MSLSLVNDVLLNTKSPRQVMTKTALPKPENPDGGRAPSVIPSPTPFLRGSLSAASINGITNKFLTSQ